jgi:CheY-like chemotaxis protein
VLVNLCLNARDALEGSGTIHLKVEAIDLEERDIKKLSRLHRGRHVVLTVQDTGPGIKAEDMDKVFEPFFTTKTAGQGTGLGLSVVHGIVHSHCGEIAINSRRGGTTVKVYLPAISHVQEPVERPTVDVRSLKMTGTILLVDDDDLVLGSLRRMLQSSGFEVIATAEGREAVDLFKERHDSIDVVVLDVIMPVMGGQEIFRLLKEIDPSVKVLFSSGYIGEDVATGLLDAGAVGFLKKPYEPEKLTTSILEALNETRPVG